MAAATGAGGAVEPPDIETAAAVFDIAMHPTRDAIAVGLIDGSLGLYTYAAAGNKLVQSFSHHTGSIRALQFSPDGLNLFTGSSDRSISGLDANGKVAWHEQGAHKAPVNALSLFAGFVLASGDDNGAVKVWDVRSRKVAYHLRHHDDVITSFTPVPEKHSLLITAGDGTLSVVDLRNGKVLARSDQLEEELLCGAVMKGGKKFAAGTTDGTVAVYTWGQWSDLSDRYPNHPGSVNCMLPLGPDALLAGTDDGNLRALSLQPNAVLALVGQHDDGGVERMALSRDGGLVASTSHGEAVQFWDLSGIQAGLASGALQAAAKPAKADGPAVGGMAVPVWRDEDEELSDDDSEDEALGGAAPGTKMAARGAGGFFSDL